MPDLSVIIPARNEEWLAKTVESVLSASRADCEVIAVLDGDWIDPPLQDHPKLHIVKTGQVIGQRAATNLGARLSSARFVCKLDAHCTVDEGWDTKLIAAHDELGRPDLLQIPAMKNLHCFNWKCRACGNETYQGPRPATCAACKAGGPFEKVTIWQPRLRRFATTEKPGSGGEVRTEHWYFDHELHFGYWKDRHKRSEAKGEIVDVMSNIGACFFLTRDYYHAIEGLDEKHGSWGQVGTELGCKVWLSGGRQVTNKRTFFCHLFRTQGVGESGDSFSFPYPMRGGDQEKARQYSRDLWYGNKWKKQIYPLSWLVERFAPVPGWSDPVGATRLARVRESGKAFLARQTTATANSFSAASGTPTPRLAGEGVDNQRMSALADRLPAVEGRDGAGTREVDGMAHELQVGRIAAGRVVADEMVELGDVAPSVSAPAHGDGAAQPRVHESGQPEATGLVADLSSERGDADLSVTPVVAGAIPDPAAGVVDRDPLEQTSDRLSVQVVDGEKLSGSHSSASPADGWLGAGERSQRASAPSILSKNPSKTCVFYTDNRIDPAIALTVQTQLQRVAPGPIVCVSLAPIDFGDARIVLPLERSVVSMFKQILAGLEATDSQWVYLTEHDCLYSPQHFAFTPPNAEHFFYNQHRWQLRSSDGFAVHYLANQVSGCCADRKLLIAHYQKRLAYIDDHGWDRNYGYEPGGNKWSVSIDPHVAETFFTDQPNVDIRHDKNLSKSKWSIADFRNKSNAKGWTEGGAIPGWGRTRGRFRDFLADVHAGRLSESSVSASTEAPMVQELRV